MRRLGLLVGVLVLAVVGRPSAADSGPPLQVPAEQLATVLRCPDTFAHLDRDPVLLVHGTGSTADESWNFAFTPALTEAGYDVCTVDIPGRALGDIQVSTEYVVAAIRTMAAATGRKVDVIGHSQGTLEPRWAVRWWPDVRASVDDMVMLAGPHHGVASASGVCVAGSCFPAAWQMAQGSAFIAALNAGDETPGTIDFTSIYSQFDELVQPVQSAVLDGAVNILVQDLCPARPVHHAGSLHDPVVFALVLDALGADGPADPTRFDPGTCTALVMPGVEPVTANLGLYGNALVAVAQAPMVPAEPEVAAYARQPETDTAPAPDPQPAPRDDPDPPQVLGARTGGTLAATGGDHRVAGAGALFAALLLAVRLSVRRISA